MSKQRAGISYLEGSGKKPLVFYLDKKAVKEMEEGKGRGIVWSDLPCFIMFVNTVDKY